jgi:3-oxoacyl-[acyl-carrier-protein] synthase-1
MFCPIGLSAPAACAAMRAGIDKFDELPYHDNQGEPIIGAMVPDLDTNLKRKVRLLELLAPAVKECLGEKPAFPSETTPLLIGLAEPGKPGGGAAWAEDILKEVQKKLGLKFHPVRSRTIAKGHTAGFEGLRIARDLLQDKDVSACLVCGVDSFINASALHWLDQHFRLKTSANQHGLIPGEAAAAVLLQRAPLPGAALELIGLGFGEEKAHVLGEEPLLGLGLTQAARAALAEAKLGFHEIDWRLSDVTGEQYGFKEVALVEGRLMRVVRKEPQPLWHWADSIGDVGAAAGIAQLVLADDAVRKGYAPGDKVICLAGSVPGDRAAAVLGRGKNATKVFP